MKICGALIWSILVGLVREVRGSTHSDRDGFHNGLSDLRPDSALEILKLLGNLFRSHQIVLGIHERQAASGCWKHPQLIVGRGGHVSSEHEVLESATTTVEKSNAPAPSCIKPEKWSPPRRALILMDGFAAYHGRYLAQAALDVYGVAVIQVLSTYMKGYFLKSGRQPPEGYVEVMPDTPDETTEWKAQFVPHQVDEIVAVVVESDSGLEDAERLAVNLDVSYHNGVEEARRNKFLMNEMVSQQSNLPTVQQRLCRTCDEAVDFAKLLGVIPADELFELNSADWNEDQPETTGLLGTGLNFGSHSTARRCCIVKPVRGVASDDVFLCENLASVETAFRKIHGSTVFGSPSLTHDSVLVQEFAYGTEYAIDIVSCNGHHKVAALWRYDKRPANGRSFVYHATELTNANSEIGTIIYEYTKAALDGLGVRWGLTHNEVILTSNGPRLVEVNCRQHNMDFCPIAIFCIGYNALDMLLAAYIGGAAELTTEADRSRLDWNMLPDLPDSRAHGAMVHIVNSSQGVLQGINEDALNEIQAMESVFALEIYPSFLELGNDVHPTVDIRTDAGWIQLMNDDSDVFQRDYGRILELMSQIFIVG